MRNLKRCLKNIFIIMIFVRSADFHSADKVNAPSTRGRQLWVNPGLYSSSLEIAKSSLSDLEQFVAPSQLRANTNSGTGFIRFRFEPTFAIPRVAKWQSGRPRCRNALLPSDGCRFVWLSS